VERYGPRRRVGRAFKSKNETGEVIEDAEGIIVESRDDAEVEVDREKITQAKGELSIKPGYDE